MGSPKIQVVRDIPNIGHEVYNTVIDSYIEHIRNLSFVESVYQMGSINDPGISDLDLVVVVKDCYDPLKMNLLSVFRNSIHDKVKDIFLHDIYLYNQNTFRQILYSNYCNNIKLIHGVEQQLDVPDRTELEILAMQIIFDFVASRLAQFQQFLASGQISQRGILVRVSSIKHSYSLLKRLGIEDSEIHDFVCKVEKMRRGHVKVSDIDILETFMASFYFFSRIVHLASRYFVEKYLNFHAVPDASNSLKLNSYFTIKFVDNAPDYYKTVKNEPTVYYPREVFFHYFAYIKSKSIFAERAKYHLCFSEDECYDIHHNYTRTLNKRLGALSDNLLFLDLNKADFSMRGNPGFLISKNTDRKAKMFKKHSSGQYKKNIPSLKQNKHHLTINNAVQAEPLARIGSCCDFSVDNLNFDMKLYEQWVLTFFPEWKKRYGHILNKKIVELFVTFQILGLRGEDEYLDVAGGINTYADRIKCKNKYLQGFAVSSELRTALGSKIDYIQGDAAKIDLPDESVSKISSHHSFEHFQGNSDSDFIKESQRLMQVGGKCCIIPIFIADKYMEVTRSNKPQCHYDKNSTYLVDSTARITGGESCGDYARIYDIPSFKKRVVDQIDRERFKVSLSEITIDGNSVPDFKLQCHEGITEVNYPYRALTIERIH